MELNGPSASSPYGISQNQTVYGEFARVLTLSQLKLNSFLMISLTLVLGQLKNIRAGIEGEQELEKMAQTMEGYQGLGTVLNRTTFLILFAQACGKACQIERGLEAIDESIALGMKTGERWVEAEAYRIKGELLVQQAEGSTQQNVLLKEAQGCYQTAVETACQQGAKTLELRAETSLCRVRKRLFEII
jgi:hypothetical protein